MPQPKRRFALIDAVSLTLMFVGFLFIPTLYYQLLEAYWRLDGSVPTITAVQESRYVWTVSLGCVSVAAALVIAVIRRRPGLIVSSIVVAIALLAAAVLFVVPQDRFTPAPEQTPLPSNYSPCFSGSDDCVGG